MADQRRPNDHIGGFNFRVELEGVQVAVFQSCSGLQSEVETIEFRSGTDRNTRKRPGRIKTSNLVLKKGYSDDQMKYLWEWYQSVLNGKVERKSGSVVLHDSHGEAVCRYNFFEAWPSKWKGWELDGAGNDVAIEEMELCVESLERVDG